MDVDDAKLEAARGAGIRHVLNPRQGETAKRIGEMAGHGVKSLYVMAFETFVGPERELRLFRDEVFPRLHAAGLH